MATSLRLDDQLKDRIQKLAHLHQRSAHDGLARTKVRTTITILLEHRRIALQHAHVVRTALDGCVDHKGAGFIDCLMLAIAEKTATFPRARSIGNRQDSPTFKPCRRALRTA